MALDEITRVLEGIGLDIRTSDGRREMRNRLDYLDRLYGDQTSNRGALDWAREMMALQPSPRAVMEWAGKKMRAEEANREVMRKTLVERMTGGAIWLLLFALVGIVGYIAAKQHLP